eukprot:jgi/Ulvmu1/497/UM001_0505.1
MSNKKAFVIGQKGVKYGLQSAPATKPAQRKPSMFGNDDDEDSLANDRNAAIRAQQGVKRGDARVKKMQAAALMEDANCFDYDSFFDGIQEKREKEKADAHQNEQAGPRYLTSMLAARDQRQRVRDMLFEKKEALAAKADDELFGEKEQFVTAAYKKKLEDDRIFAEQLAAKDKNDEGRTVDAQGMDGFLSVIESAMAKRAATAEEAPETDAAAAEDEVQAAGGVQPKSGSFEAVMARKAKLRLEKKLAEMDRYERKRFELERGLVQPAARARGEEAGGADGARDDGGVSAGGDAGAKEAEAEKQPQAAPRKRTAEEKIEAARARAKERKMKR